MRIRGGSAGERPTTGRVRWVQASSARRSRQTRTTGQADLVSRRAGIGIVISFSGKVSSNCQNGLRIILRPKPIRPFRMRLSITSNRNFVCKIDRQMILFASTFK